MAAARTLVSLQEYLRTAYSPDVDYVDRELQERNMGEGQHSAVQKFFIASLAAGGTLETIVDPEQRLDRRPRVQRKTAEYIHGCALGVDCRSWET